MGYDLHITRKDCGVAPLETGSFAIHRNSWAESKKPPLFRGAVEF
jgi:hypothetical protein